jgi:hypothetical protein
MVCGSAALDLYSGMLIPPAQSGHPPALTRMGQEGLFLRMAVYEQRGVVSSVALCACVCAKLQNLQAQCNKLRPFEPMG